MTGCDYAFCAATARATVPGIGDFCVDHLPEARRVARFRDHGLRARNRRHTEDAQNQAELDRRNQLALEVQ